MSIIESILALSNVNQVFVVLSVTLILVWIISIRAKG